MDGLTTQIINRNHAALELAKTLITTPTLINIDIRQGALYALPLQCETNQKSANAEVSESLVISSEAKKYISDNVAPGAKQWQLSGYIPGIKQLEPTNYFQPFVQLQTDILWSWFDHGAVLIFKDGNAQIHKKVVIKALQTAQQKDCANATPFTMTLKEINVMETTLANAADTETTAINKLMTSLPAVGSALGAAVSLGATAATVTEKLSA